MLRLATLTALIVAVPGLAAPGLPEKEDATIRELVEALFKDAARQDWTAYAKRMDPAGLKAFRDDFAKVLTSGKEGADAQFVPLFDGARDLKAVLAYSPEEFFARFMKGATAAAINLSAERAEVLGAVAEGPDKAHVVVRVSRKFPGTEKGVVEVVSVRKAAGVWRVELPKELAMMTASLKMIGGVETQRKVDVILPDPPKK